MLLPAIGKVGPAAATEEEEAAAVSRQLLLERFRGSVEVDSIEGVDFFSFSSAEDLREFARSMDQLMGERYREEPRSPEGSAPSARSAGAAEDEWREADWASEEPQSVVVLPRKTTDITKIKGWRRKAFTADSAADDHEAAADQTTRWVMDQMNEQAWRTRQGPQQQGAQRRPPAPGATVGSSAPGEQGGAQPPAAPGVLSKSVRGAFLSSSLDEFLEHRAELRVGQLAQLNPNIVPPPQGQGVLALSAPPAVAPPAPAVGPVREMTSHVPRRYRQAATESAMATRSTRSEKVDGQRRPSAGASQPPEPEQVATPPSPKQPAAKRAKVDIPEEAPFLAMTARQLRGSGQAPVPDSASAPSKEAEPKPKPEPKKAKEVPPPVPPYGASAGSGDYPLVTETVLSGKQRELLRLLLVSTQCSRPLTVALPAEPCFVCPQLDQGDALAAANALYLPGQEKKPDRAPPVVGRERSTRILRNATRREEEARRAEDAAATAAKAVTSGASGEVAKRQALPPAAATAREPATKAGPAEAAGPKTPPRQPRACPPPGGGGLASPPEAPQSTRSRRPIRLPVRFKDSALYFSPNGGDLFDGGLPVSPRQRPRPQPPASSAPASIKVAAAPRPPVPVPPAVEDPLSTSTSSWTASSSSSSSSASSSRSSSPCDGFPPSTGPQRKKQVPHLNGGQTTLKQLSRLKTDGFVSLHKLESQRPSSTSPEGSVDIDVESISDTDSANPWMRLQPGKEKLDDKACRERQRRHEMFKLFLHLQNVVFRTPRTRPLSKISILSQASQYLRCQKVLSAYLTEEEKWQHQRRAVLEVCLEAVRAGRAPPAQLPKLGPRPAPLPSYVGRVCDLTSPTVAPLREPLEEAPAPPVPSPLHGLPVGSGKKHTTSGKEKHAANSGGAEQPALGGARDTAPGPGAPVTTFKVDDGRIGALRSVPAADSDVPRKYTLYPVKGTVLGDLSKVAAAAQHIIGPCVIKRVKLRSGQTVFVYRQPAADGTLPKEEEGGHPPGEEAAKAQGEERAADPPDQGGSSSSSSQGPSSPAQGSPASPRSSPGSPESPQDDAGLGETSEWVSGDGDTCIVMKLPVSSDEDSGSSSEDSES